MLLAPTGNAAVSKVAVPLAKAEVPSTVVPLLKVTVPVAVEGLTVAVNVTDAPQGELGVEKPGLSRLKVRVAPQAVAKLLTSDEPKPATRLYPVAASTFDALKPITPNAGHCSAGF